MSLSSHSFVLPKGLDLYFSCLCVSTCFAVGHHYMISRCLMTVLLLSIFLICTVIFAVVMAIVISFCTVCNGCD